MKINFRGTFIILFTICFAGCNAQTKTKEKNQPQSDKTTSTTSNIDLQAPDLADPALKKYFQSYTAYLKNVLTGIRNKDEAGTMKLLGGKEFKNKNEMEQKATSSTLEEKQKFNTWLMQSAPYQMEIVQSAYYKKYNEEYYKNVKEEFKKKGY